VVWSISVLLYVLCSECLAYLNLNETGIAETRVDKAGKKRKGEGRGVG